MIYYRSLHSIDVAINQIRRKVISADFTCSSRSTSGLQRKKTSPRRTTKPAPQTLLWFIAQILLSDNAKAKDVWIQIQLCWINNWNELSISKSVRFVGAGIAVLSVIYSVITLTTARVKWGWIQESYKRLKDNYRDILDGEDIKQAFSDDEHIKSARKRLLCIAIVVGALWVLLVCVMIRMFGVFTFQ